MGKNLSSTYKRICMYLMAIGTGVFIQSYADVTLTMKIFIIFMVILAVILICWTLYDLHFKKEVGCYTIEEKP